MYTFTQILSDNILHYRCTKSSNLTIIISSFSVLTWLVWQQERHPACKKHSGACSPWAGQSNYFWGQLL